MLPAPLLFVIVAVSNYAGSAVAVLLFDRVDPAGVAWLRVTFAAVILCAWRRPWRVIRTRRAVVLALSFGVVTASMNLLFFLAIDELPLGTAVAIEFIGPVTVAAVGSRRARDVAALAVAVVAVLLLADVQWEASPRGLAFILGAAFAWATYIVLGHRVAAGGTGIDGLALGMVAGAVAIAPIGALPSAPAFGAPELVLAAVVVAALCTVVPYALEQVLLHRLERAHFALLLAILPATATLVGLVALRQIPEPIEIFGIALVVVAILLRSPEGARETQEETGTTVVT